MPTHSATDSSLSQAIREQALHLGAELYGVASASAYAAHFPDKPQPTRFVPNAQSVIVFGLPFEPGTMATVLSPELAGLDAKAADNIGSAGVQPAGAERFFLAEENDAITRELTWIGYRLAKYLRRQGFAALHLPASKQNTRFRTAPFYHMPAMYLAGMGTLGLNCSILTPEFGPRVFVSSLITDAPLTPGSPMQQDLCTHCEKCVNACPIGAIDGQGWKNAFACASYGCCSTCIAICPVGELRPF
jgi:epoxyqueuosine reductase QueG